MGCPEDGLETANMLLQALVPDCKGLVGRIAEALHLFSGHAW
jgi:hypothetical protein